MVKVNEKATVADTVYITYEYSMFNRLEGNRSVKDKAKKEIAASIDEVGQLNLPILVNEKMEVIEGQHRLEVCKDKGLPIRYIIQHGIGLKECQALNKGTNNWKNFDYIDSYAEEGKPSFKILKSLHEKHPKASLSDLAAALTGAGKMSSYLITKGTLDVTMDQARIADEALSWALPFMDKFDRRSFKGAKGYLQITLIILYRFSKEHDININRLEEVIDDKLSMNATWANVETCIQVLEKAYNLRLARENKRLLHSIYRQFLLDTGNKNL